MDTTFDEISGNTLAPNFRAMLAEHLLRSLDSIDQTEIDTAWAIVALHLKEFGSSHSRPTYKPSIPHH